MQEGCQFYNLKQQIDNSALNAMIFFIRRHIWIIN